MFHRIQGKCHYLADHALG